MKDNCFFVYCPNFSQKKNRFYPVWAAWALVLILVTGCAPGRRSPDMPPNATDRKLSPYQINGVWYYPVPHARDFSQDGIASWYGKDFHGKKTANGEIYDMYAMTAAHKTLPINTWVQVTNISNNRKIIVRVNDRGPFVAGRIIDLSYTAAQKLDMVGPGTTRVRVTALGTPEPGQPMDHPTRFVPGDYYSGNFVVQVGAFIQKDNAEKLVSRLAREYDNAHFIPFSLGKNTFYRVRVGLFSDLNDARTFEKQMATKGFPQAFVVAE